MAQVSVVVSAYNEEKKLPDCLKSVLWADEIVVVDSGSTDTTSEIAKKFGATVLRKENNLMLNVNKNFGFGKATSDWILNIDADERVSVELASEIQKTLKNPKEFSGYWIPRKNIIFGKWIQNSIWWPDLHLRLFKKGKGRFAQKHVHEHVELSGKAGTLKNALIHENYQSISQYLYKMDKIYTENEVENFLMGKETITYLDAIRFPFNDFLKTFFSQKGYKDGLHGLVLSMLQAFYSFIVFAKVWEKKGFKEESSSRFLDDLYAEGKKIVLEYQYWFLTEFIEKAKSPIKKIYLKTVRKNIDRKLKQ